MPSFEIPGMPGSQVGMINLSEMLGKLGGGRTKTVKLPVPLDSVAYGMPVGWLFGRLGCFVVHDHPGHITDVAECLGECSEFGCVCALAHDCTSAWSRRCVL